MTCLIEWLNAAMLFISTPLSMYIYSLSVRPATLEKKIGEKAYPRCALYRIISSVFMFVAIIGYVLYIVYPLPLPLPLTFPWEY